ncbi:MAG: Trk family potassium uptake protein [Elusimicrobia bacterium]|nr:Trk family potassium uptake protein [Elusimicrobiota bacterium]
MFTPHRVLAIGFASLILVGALLLSMPFAGARGQHTTFVDALFTATSAICVTGLITVDTATHYSLWGKSIILLLIQMGGLGYITLATMMFMLFNKQLNIKDKLNIQEGVNQYNLADLGSFVKYIVKFTFLIEGLATLILTSHWSREFPIKEAFGQALFHCVSAFCNAGFSTFSNNLSNYVTDVVVNLTITSLIIIGGLGFIVINELYNSRRWKKISVHTRIAVKVTAWLLLVGTVVILILEYNNPAIMAALPLDQKILISYFQAVTPRTAGFNTVNIGWLQPATLFFVIILMFIGASPGGTGGGIKTTTFGLMIASVMATLRGKYQVNMYNRRIPGEIIRKSFVLTLVSLSLVILVTTGLAMIEKGDFLRILFEVVSAFGTVGLSAVPAGTLSLAGYFSDLGKLLLVITMYFGRVGPLTLGIALMEAKGTELFSYAEEKVLIG